MNLSPVLTFSTGIMAGLGTTLSLVAAPAVLASKDPLPSWQTVYNNGSKIALTSIFVTTATGLTIYFKSTNPDPKVLIATGLSFVIAPYTILFMKPTNKTLLGMDPKAADKDDAEIKKLIQKWIKLQWVRTGLGLGAFAVTIGLAVCTKH